MYTECLGINNCFQVFITPESTLRHKPHPEPVLKAIKELSAIPEKTLFVGDTFFDVLSGKSAGVDTYLVQWNSVDNKSKQNLQKIVPTYCENNLEKILTLF